MKLRVGDPWMPASEYSRTLKGLTLNFLVKEIEPALRFAQGVLGAEVVYSDPDFAVLSAYGAEWMLHADHTYDKHPMGDTVSTGAARGPALRSGCTDVIRMRRRRRRGTVAMR